MRKVNRRQFLRLTGLAALSVSAACTTPPPAANTPAGGATNTVPSPTTGPSATATAAKPKILRIRLYGDIQNIDPAFRVSANDDAVGAGVISGLVTYAPNSYEIANDLAETITSSEDGKEITFKLKEGVKWHKGYGEVTTEDVKFSYERFTDPDLKAAYADDWAALDHVEIIDKYNGKIILKEPFAPLWRSTLPVASGWVLPKKYVEEIGYEKFATNILGCGPYLFSEWKPKERVILTRNPDYSEAAPYYDEIHFIPIEDDKAAEVALEAGELDWSRISIDSYDRFAGNAQFQVLKQPALRYRWIGMNIENPKLQDINVRQAIRYGIDVPSILAAGYMGQAEQEFGLIAPGLIGHWKDAPRYQRDVAKAKDFMSKAGLTSIDLRLDIQNTSEYRTWAEIAQQNLKEVGINIQINPLDSSSFWSLGEGDAGKNAELFANNYSMEPDPSWATMWFTTEQIGVWNWMRWSSPEYDELHKQGLTTIDPAERDKIYVDMQKLWDEACHSVFITHGSMTYAYAPGIKPATTPHGLIQPVSFAAG